MTPDQLWPHMLFGYLFTIAIETPVLLIGLSKRHSFGVRLFCGFWLTACTYPILWMVLPHFIDYEQSRTLYLAVGETFVPIAECALFWIAFGSRPEWGKRSMWQDLAAVTVANLLSFGGGELLYALGGTL